MGRCVCLSNRCYWHTVVLDALQMAEPRNVTDRLGVVHRIEVELVRIGVYQRLVTDKTNLLELALRLGAHL